MNVSTRSAHDSCTLDPAILTPSKLRRDSKHSPPDRPFSKQSRLQMSSDSFDMKTNIEHIITEQSGVLKAGDLHYMAEPVKAALMSNIRKLISAATTPLQQEISSLKAENAKVALTDSNNM